MNWVYYDISELIVLAGTAEDKSSQTILPSTAETLEKLMTSGLPRSEPFRSDMVAIQLHENILQIARFLEKPVNLCMGLIFLSKPLTSNLKPLLDSFEAEQKIHCIENMVFDKTCLICESKGNASSNPEIVFSCYYPVCKQCLAKHINAWVTTLIGLFII